MKRDISSQTKQFAFSRFEIKTVNDEQRIIEGWATTPSTDRMDDIVEPDGAVYKLPIPLLWQHDCDEPIGNVIEVKVSAAGIWMRAQILSVIEEGNLKARLDEAWQSIKYGLVRGLSIGFRSLEYAQIDGSWGVRFTSWEWLELSAVTVPANADCSITAIKAIDRKQRAASGQSLGHVVRLDSKPGVSGKPSKPTPKGPEMKTIAEQIEEFMTKRGLAITRMTEIMNTAAEKGETLDSAAKTEHDELSAEVATIDDHVKRLKAHEKLMVTGATRVTVENTQTVDDGAAVRTGEVLSVKRRLPKGTAFTRYAMALAHSKGNLMQAEMIAARWKDTTPEVAAVLRAAAMMGSTHFKAAAVGDTVDATFAGPLVYYDNMQSEFIELLRPRTILGKIPGLRKVPFNVRIAGQTSGSTAGWVGEGAPKPVGELGFNSVNLGHSKAAGIIVITQELARFASPAAESLVSDDLMKAIATFLDQQFIDPAVAAVANVSPASVTHGLTPIPSSGSTLAEITSDVEALMKTFIAAELDPTQAVWVMKPSTALALSLKRTSQDIFTFPDIRIDGGTWFGLPVVTSNSVPGSASGGTMIALVIANEVFMADDGQIALDVSQEASVQMSSTPSAGAQNLVSLWQNNLVGLRAEREINWQRRRDAAVGYIDQVNY